MPNSDDRFRPAEGSGTPEANEVPAPPQFGQRSAGWQPTPADPTIPSGPSADRPWPVYHPEADSGYPSDNGPRQVSSQDYPPNFSSPMPQAPLALTRQVPSRTGPILTMVLGAVLSIIVAPAVLFGIAISGLNMDSMLDGSATVVNGGQVTVDQSGVVGIISQTSTQLDSCTLTRGSETVTARQESDTGIVVGRNLTPGTYTVDCGVPAGQPLFVFRGDELNTMMSSVLKGVGWSAVPGFGGIVMFVVGLVWLVKRNRQRKEAFRKDWGSGTGGFHGPAGPYNPPGYGG